MGTGVVWDMCVEREGWIVLEAWEHGGTGFDGMVLLS